MVSANGVCLSGYDLGHNIHGQIFLSMLFQTAREATSKNGDILGSCPSHHLDPMLFLSCGNLFCMSEIWHCNS